MSGSQAADFATSMSTTTMNNNSNNHHHHSAFAATGAPAMQTQMLGHKAFADFFHSRQCGPANLRRPRGGRATG